MKNYRPFETHEEIFSLIGKIVIAKDSSVFHMITSASIDYKTIAMGNGIMPLDSLLDMYLFPDKSPCGVLREIELIHDKMYLVRDFKEKRWIGRHFCRNGISKPMFYRNGVGSWENVGDMGCPWNQVAEYDSSLVGTCNEPLEYLVNLSE